MSLNVDSGGNASVGSPGAIDAIKLQHFRGPGFSSPVGFQAFYIFSSKTKQNKIFASIR
jgi:hypothetical protein